MENKKEERIHPFLQSAHLFFKDFYDFLLQIWKVRYYCFVNVLHAQRLILMCGNIPETGDLFPSYLRVRQAAFLRQILYQLTDIDHRHADGALEHFIVKKVCQ